MPKRDTFEIGGYWLTRNPRSPYWCRTWYDRERQQTRRASLGESDLERAKVKLAEWFLATVRPKDADPGDIPLSVVLDDYLKRHAVNLPSYDQAKIAVAHLEGFLGGALVADLTIERQEAYIGHRLSSLVPLPKGSKAVAPRRVSSGTVSRELSVLRAALKRAYRRGELKHVPFIIDCDRGLARERHLSLEEFGALFDAAKSDHLVMFLMVAANTLARPAAVLELKPFQADLKRRLMSLNPPGRKQSKKYRPTVPITNTLLPWLQSVKANHIVNYHGRKVASIKTAFRAARADAGLGPDVTPYTIRHTMATELRSRDVPEWEVQGMLGHQRDRVTETYAKFRPNYLGKAAQAIDAYFAELQKHTKRRLILPSEGAARLSVV